MKLKAKIKSEESRIRFLVNFIKNPKMVGSVAPSSQSLTDAMIAGLDSKKQKCVYEYGPGTGVFTKGIIGQLGKNGIHKLTAIELAPEFSKVLKNRFQGLKVETKKASEVSPPKGQSVDFIVSSLPFTFIPWEETEKTIQHVGSILSSDGVFRTYLYVQSLMIPTNIRLLFLLRKTFSKVSIQIVLRNLPPAAVITCTQPSSPRN